MIKVYAPENEILKKSADEQDANLSTAHRHDIESEINSSVAIVGLVTFVGDCARGILFPVLWPLCQSLGGTKVDYG